MTEYHELKSLIDANEALLVEAMEQLKLARVRELLVHRAVLKDCLIEILDKLENKAS